MLMNCFFRLAVAAICLASVNATAAVVYSNTFTPNTGTLSDASNGIFVYDRFSLGAPANVDAVEWRGFYPFQMGSLPLLDQFTINFYNDNSGLPGTLQGSFPLGNAVNRVGTGQFFDPGVEFFAYRATLGAGLDLDAGTHWISIFNNTLVELPDWHWATDIFLPPTGLLQNAGEFSPAFTYFYVLSDTMAPPNGVSEPTPLILLGVALAMLGITRRRVSPI
jgi:hypothetical protein